MPNSPIKKNNITLFALTLAVLFLAHSVRAQAQNSATPQQPTGNELARDLGEFKIKVPTNLLPSLTKSEATAPDNATAPTAPPPAPTTQVTNFGDRSISRDRNAPRRDNLQAIKIVDHVNALIGGFEQSAGFPFGIELTTADLIPGIEFYGRVLTSTRLYRRFEFGSLIGNKTTRGDIWFTYLRRTRDHFYGIGPRTPFEINETNFSIEQRSFNASFAHRFRQRLDVGAYVRVSNTGSFRGENEDEPAIDALFSDNPAVVPITRFLPGLNNNVRLFGYGVYGELDARDDSVGLTKGGYFYGRVSSVDGLKNGNRPSDFGWHETELDGRLYLPLFSHKTSLALRGHTLLRDAKGASQIPFYELAFFGGRSWGRGFSNFRFRGNNSVLFATELRQTVFEQNETRGVDVFAFVDTGQVWGDNRSRTNPLILANDSFARANWRIGSGGGAQYRFNKSIAARVDIGLSNERTMVYFSVSRGF